MSDGDGLLEAICKNPGDDLLRLVYADWLEEHGQSVRVLNADGERDEEKTTALRESNAARAEFIRLQIELAGACDESGRETLEVRERELLDNYRTEWLPPDAWHDGWCVFHRGFPVCNEWKSVRLINTPVFLGTDEDLMHARKEVMRTNSAYREGGVLSHPNPERLRHLNLWGAHLNDPIEIITESTKFKKLQSLGLRGFHVSYNHLRMLADEKSHIKNLLHLDLENNRNIGVHLDIITDSKNFKHLQSLNVRDCRLNEGSLRVLADEKSHIKNLLHLNLLREECIANHMDILTGSENFKHVQSLNIADCRLNEGSLHALADEKSHIKNLLHLDLSTNYITSDHMDILTGSKNLEHLQSLHMSFLNESGLRALADEKSHIKNLVHLDLGYCQRFKDHLGMLAGSNNFEHLQFLDMYGCCVTGRQSEPLLEAIRNSDRFKSLRRVRTDSEALNCLFAGAIEEGIQRRIQSWQNPEPDPDPDSEQEIDRMTDPSRFIGSRPHPRNTPPTPGVLDY